MKLFDDVVVVSAHNGDRRDDRQTSGILDFAAGNIIHIHCGIFTANISTEPGFSGAPVFASRKDDYSCMAGMHRGHREAAGVPYSYGIGIRKIRYLYGIYKNGAPPGGGANNGIKYQIR